MHVSGIAAQGPLLQTDTWGLSPMHVSVPA